jgi:hypothetical protein
VAVDYVASVKYFLTITIFTEFLADKMPRLEVAFCARQA